MRDMGGEMKSALSIPRTKKIGYLNQLSEDEFRDQVVRPLMLRLGYGDGRDTCGPAEQGKDAIFTEQDRLGNLRITAVQTKRGNINMSQEASANLINAVTQLRMALEAPVQLIGTRRSARVNSVILCASGSINDLARRHIVDEIKDSRLVFLDRDELIPMIDRDFAELWQGVETELLPYYRAINKMVVNGGNDSNDKQTEVASVLLGAATDACFVPIGLRRTRPVIKRKQRKISIEQQVVDVPIASALNIKAKKILIISEAGSGKSTCLLRIAYEQTRHGVPEGDRYRIPVLLRAADIARAGEDALLAICDRHTREMAGGQAAVFSRADLLAGRVVLLIDALDEIADDELRARVVGLIEQFCEQYPNVKVLVTSRPRASIREDDRLQQYEEYKLRPIGWRDAERIIQAVQSRGATKITEGAQEVLRRLEQLHGLELNPLLVTVFAATAEYSRQDIPANITELFKKFTEVLLGRWHLQKPLSKQYHAPLKDFLLQKLAFQMHSSERTSITRDEASQLVEAELRKCGQQADVEQICMELFELSGLFRHVGTEVEFRHHMLQEFFAGRGIASGSAAVPLVSSEWWKRPIVFYFGEHPEGASRLREIAETIAAPTVAPLESLEATTTIGLALQACYLSPVEEKLSMWKWVVDRLIDLEVGVLAAEDSSQTPLLDYLAYYLSGRESVALSHLADKVDEMSVWAGDAALHEGVQERRLFWLITGLMEARGIEKAELLSREFSPSDVRMALAVNLAAFLCKEVRVLTSSERRAATRIHAHTESSVTALAVKVKKEIGTYLLEEKKQLPGAKPNLLSRKLK